MYGMLIYILFLPLYSQNGNFHNIESVIRFGDSLFFNRNYSLALCEFQRAYFFAGNDLKSDLGKKIADCLFKMEDYKLARSYYDTASYYSENDSLKVSLELSSILCIIMENDFGYALLRLHKMDSIPFRSLINKHILYKGICHFGTGQYDESLKYFQSCLPPEDTTGRSQLKILLEKRKSLKRPYSSLAIVLSILLPGAGQTYSGDIKDGINSLLLLTGIVYMGSSGSFPGNLLVIAPIFQRYYIGGIVNAKRLADAKRRQKQSEYYSDLMNILF